MRFNKDIFISYAHLDNKPLDEGTKGWISDFHALLETRLQQTIGHELIVWRDERLTGNETFGEEIEAQLRALKILVPIITPRYMQSEWCRRELTAFYQLASETGGVSIGNKSRIFKIMKTPIDREAIKTLPEIINRIFNDILDYQFYLREPGTGKFKELSRYSWVDNSIRQEYMNKLDDVVQDMVNLIKLLNKSEDKAGVKKKIYLAETSYDLQLYRDNLVRELQEANFIVLPDKHLPLIADQFNSDVRSYLDESLLSLHLVSPNNYATQPEGADKSLVILQNEIAAHKSSETDFKRLIWIPPSTEITVGNEKMAALQRAFVDELKSNVELQKGADIIEGPLEEFKLAIFDTIARINAEEEKKAAAAEIIDTQHGQENNRTKLVYLMCDKRDLDNSMPLENLLTENGCEVLLPVFEGDQAQVRQAHMDNLKICDAVIIYYGSANYRWVGSMKSDLLRLPATGRINPLSAKAIYIDGPADQYKETFKSNDIEIINGTTGFKPEMFSKFIQYLK